MADVAKRVGPVVLGTVATTVYTVPAATSSIVRWLSVCNVTAAAVTFFLSVGVDAVGTRVFSAYSVAGNSTLEDSGLLLPLATGEVIQAYAGTGASLTLTIGTIETS
jgi:hypothetical protein